MRPRCLVRRQGVFYRRVDAATVAILDDEFRRHQGNLTRVAEALELSRHTLYSLLHRFELLDALKAIREDACRVSVL